MIFVAFQATQELYQDYLLQKEISALEEEAEKLESRRLELLEVAERIQSGEFLEEEARLKLGLQRPGEQVVVVQMEEEGGAEDQGPKSNPELWLEYFLRE